MWKSSQRSNRVNPIWIELYEVLRLAVKKEEAVICPATPFHDEEGSLNSRLAMGIHDVSVELSQGVEFLRWNELLDNQAKRALYRYLGKRVEEPEWRDAFNTDPYEPISERSVEFMGSSLLIDAFMSRPREFTAEHRATKDAYLRDLDACVPTPKRRTFNEELKQQKQSFVRERFVQPLLRVQESSEKGEFPSLVDMENWDSFRFLKTEFEGLCREEGRFEKFLTSEALYETPFLDVFCSIYAAMNFYLRNRRPKPGDFDDVAILATVLPYCDIVTTDNEMKDICMRAGLHTKYRVDIYSPRLEDVRALIANLTDRRS